MENKKIEPKDKLVTQFKNIDGWPMCKVEETPPTQDSLEEKEVIHQMVELANTSYNCGLAGDTAMNRQNMNELANAKIDMVKKLLRQATQEAREQERERIKSIIRYDIKKPKMFTRWEAFLESLLSTLEGNR